MNEIIAFGMYLTGHGYDWYVDNNLTNYANNKRPNNLKPLKAVCFFVKKEDTLTRVLIGKDQEVLHDDTSLEGMACYINMLRLLKTK